MPSRLLLVPTSRTISHRLSGALSFFHSSAGAPSTSTTRSRRPSPSKSATPHPRCAATAVARPDAAVPSPDRPPAALAERVVGFVPFAASDAPHLSFHREFGADEFFP